MNKILGAMRRAIVEYEMISPGDKVAVGVSGGKDSMVLLQALGQLQQFIDIPFSLVALTIDPQFDKKPNDFSAVQELCDSFQMPYYIKRSELGEIIFDVRKESNPCSLCSRMRRGMLHDMVVEQGCNKLALGHHRDDAIETFLMNLVWEGRIGCFRPVTYLSRKNITMIRPMIYITEHQVQTAVALNHLPTIESGCPADGATQREEVKRWLTERERGELAGLRRRLFGAIQRGEIDGWKDFS